MAQRDGPGPACGRRPTPSSVYRQKAGCAQGGGVAHEAPAPMAAAAAAEAGRGSRPLECTTLTPPADNARTGARQAARSGAASGRGRSHLVSLALPFYSSSLPLSPALHPAPRSSFPRGANTRRQPRPPRCSSYPCLAQIMWLQATRLHSVIPVSSRQQSSAPPACAARQTHTLSARGR